MAAASGASPVPAAGDEDGMISPAPTPASLVDPMISQEQIDAFLARAKPEDLRLVAYELETDAGLAARLLRARKGDIEKALVLLGEISKWRVENKVRELALTANAYDLLGGVTLDELQPFHQKTYFPYPDKQGRPIYIERTGCCDPAMMSTLVSLDLLAKHHEYTQETDSRGLCALASKAAGGRAIVATTSILDMSGMSMKVASAEARAFVKRCAAIDSAYYPETMGTMLIINAPSVFTMAWAMVKGFLDERTVAKIQILGGPSSWQPKLEALVDRDKIPVEYGGTLKVPGGLFKPSRTNKVQLAAGKEHVLEHAVTQAGQVVRFKWLCKPGDIKFSVDFVAAADGKRAQLVAPQSSSSSKETASGEEKWSAVTVQAPAAGMVIGVFDNKAGWRQRELWCRTDLMVPVSTAVGAVGAGAGGAGGPPVFKPELALTMDSIFCPPDNGPFSAAAWAAFKDEMQKRGPGPCPAP